jgi:thiamine biosynthesis lipoprotein
MKLMRMSEDSRRGYNFMANAFSRRDFIRITAILGAGVGVSAAAARSVLGNRVPKSVLEHRILMGSPATLEVICEDEAFGREAIQQTFAEMYALEKIFSRFLEDSQLSTLNREGYLHHPHPALLSVLELARSISDLSHGAFDITIEPLLSYYRRRIQAGEAFDPAVVSSLQKRVDYTQVQAEPDEIKLLRAGTQITLDGIAKGYVIDRGANSLRAIGFANILVEVGGDLQTFGNAADRPWQVGIQSPRPNIRERIGVMQLSDMAVASSGDYANYFTEDLTLNHILDPRSGLSPREVAGATVVAPTASQADALSTTVMVLGMEEGLSLIESLNNVEGLLIGKDLSLRASSGMQYQPA